MAGSNGNGLYEVRRSGIQGRGVFAKRRIRAGQRIIEYAGERVSNEEADRRYDEENMKRHHTFLFTLDKKTVVDGARRGNDARLINHSCDPNCEAIIEDGKIWIYAKGIFSPESSSPTTTSTSRPAIRPTRNSISVYAGRRSVAGQ